MYPDTRLRTENSEVGKVQRRNEIKGKGGKRGGKGRKGGKGQRGGGSEGTSGEGAGVGRLWPVGAVYLYEVYGQLCNQGVTEPLHCSGILLGPGFLICKLRLFIDSTSQGCSTSQ